MAQNDSPGPHASTPLWQQQPTEQSQLRGVLAFMDSPAFAEQAAAMTIDQRRGWSLALRQATPAMIRLGYRCGELLRVSDGRKASSALHDVAKRMHMTKGWVRRAVRLAAAPGWVTAGAMTPLPSVTGSGEALAKVELNLVQAEIACGIRDFDGELVEEYR